MKLVIRLLDADNRLLGWCEHQAAVKGDGCLRAQGPVVLTPDVDGRGDTVSVHWADVNVETRVLFAGWVRAGIGFVLYAHDAVLMQCGQMPTSLPPVTMKTSAIVYPLTGGIGARGA